MLSPGLYPDPARCKYIKAELCPHIISVFIDHQVKL